MKPLEDNDLVLAISIEQKIRVNKLKLPQKK